MAFLFGALADALLMPLPLSRRLRALPNIPELHNGRTCRQVDRFARRARVAQRLGLIPADG